MKKLIEEINKSFAGPALMSGHEISNTYCFDAGFLGFSGHFPGYPILPAVMQLLLAQLLTEELKGYEIRVTSIEKAKFLSEIRPHDPVTVICTNADTDNSARSMVKIVSGERAVSSFTICFRRIKEDMNC
jgi:3-hydroxyacyl-[acyl-carrier-protein] dehydratase